VVRDFVLGITPKKKFRLFSKFGYVQLGDLKKNNEKKQIWSVVLQRNEKKTVVLSRTHYMYFLAFSQCASNTKTYHNFKDLFK